MNTAAILIPAALLYSGLLYWIFVRFNLRAVWRGAQAEGAILNGKTLARNLKRALDFLLVFCVFNLIVWPPLLLVMAISQSMIPTWGIDIEIFSGFRIDGNALAGLEFSGLRKPELSGKTLVAIDTSSLHAWYLFAAISEASAAAALYVLVHLRALVMSVARGDSFGVDNGRRMRKIGQVVIAWSIVMPLLQYFAWGSVVKDISFSSPGLQLYPAFELNVMGLLLGFLLIVLSDLLKEAAEMNTEQELTI
jgi:hypothetical protein